MLVWLIATPLLMRREQRENDAAEAELWRACAARQPFWALWRRRRLAQGCYTRALARLRATQPFPPPSLTLKHFAHLDVVSTHHVGAAIWTAAGMAQFGLSRSGPADRRRHRLVGRLYMLAVALLTVGFLRIDTHDLHFDNDFRAAFPGDVPPRKPVEHALISLVLYGLQCWFVFTAGKAWLAARARRLDAHRAWIVRHVASGMWVVVMRALAGVLNAVVFAAVRLGMGAPGGVAKMWLFAGSGALGTLVSFAGAERYLRVMPAAAR